MVLDVPSRLNIQIEGGVDHTPRFTLKLTGADHQGESLEISGNQNDFVWQHNRGYFTSEAVFSRVDLLHCEGLSRVYKISVLTPTTDGYDVNALLPLWSIAVPPEHAQKIITDLTNPDLFWRPTGVTMGSAQDADFDPANRDGTGGVWPFLVDL